MIDSWWQGGDVGLLWLMHTRPNRGPMHMEVNFEKGKFFLLGPVGCVTHVPTCGYSKGQLCSTKYSNSSIMSMGRKTLEF